MNWIKKFGKWIGRKIGRCIGQKINDRTIKSDITDTSSIDISSV